MKTSTFSILFAAFAAMAAAMPSEFVSLEARQGPVSHAHAVYLIVLTYW